MGRKLEVTVTAEQDDIIKEKYNIFISFPKEQEKVSIKTASHILISGVSLLVKCSEKEGEENDYELMEEIITHLNSEFISAKSFNDLKVNKQGFKKITRHG